jgi:acyl dehydratase
MPAAGLPRAVTELIGVESDLIWAPVPVHQTLIDHWCEVFEDAYPCYTDAEAARAHCGGIVAPPLAIMALVFPYAWRPPALAGREPAPRETRVSHIRGELLGLTGVVDLEVDKEWFEPLRLGDRFGVRRQVVDIRGPRETAIGTGYEVLYAAHFYNQHLRNVAASRTTLFAYRPESGPGRPLLRSRVPGVYPDLSEVALHAPDPGEEVLPALRVPNTFGLHVRVASATRDFSAFHHDRDYVRARGGVEEVYASMLYIQGLTGRYVTDWSGPGFRLARLHGRVGGLVHPGDTIILTGRVARRYQEEGRARVDLSVLVKTEHVPVMVAEATVEQS